MIGSSSPYDIARPVRECASTGAPISVGDHFVAVLVDLPGEEALTRQDFSLDAWDGGARPKAPGQAFAFWRTTASDPNEQKKPPLGHAEPMDLLSPIPISRGRRPTPRLSR